MASLNSPLAKFHRATQQCEALDRDLLSLSDLKSYGITKDIDNDTGYQIYSFESVPSMPDDIGLRVGEMLYNFRCSIDHLIWQLVLSEGNEPTFRNEFPIFLDISKYNNEKRSKLKGVPNAVIPIIDSLQPCNSTGVNDHWWYLWYLHVLCNADKHRYLLLTRRTLGKKLRMSWTSSKAPKALYLNAPVEDGEIFLHVKPNIDVDIHPTIQIFFSNAPSDIREDLPVKNIIDLIHASVFEVFERLSSHIE